MGAYENAICEEGTREELIEHWLIARSENATLTAALEEARVSLEIIAGKRQCLDNLMGNGDVARAALATIKAALGRVKG